MTQTARPQTRRRKRDITEQVAVRILEILAEERPTPGAHLSAQRLADQMEVSRSPVVQALRMLSDKGVVEHQHNRGFFHTGRIVTPERLGLDSGDALREVYFRIAEDRLTGALEERISESALRDRYGLTRGELSALLGRIAAEGWAERRAGYGWSFPPVLTTPEALDQTYRLRAALEPNALREPGFHMDRETLLHWSRVEEKLLAGDIETVSAETLHDRGVKFHEAVVSASGNPFFLDALKRVNQVRRLLAYRAMLDRSRYYSQAAEHLQILELIGQGRQEDAAEKMREHLTNVSRNLNKIRDLLETPIQKKQTIPTY